MPTVHRRLKVINFSLDDGVGSPTQYECQINSWSIVNNTEDGERFFTFCSEPGEDEFREEADDDYALELSFFSDWNEEGISDFLTTHDQQEVIFELHHHPDIPDEYVIWGGTLKVKAPTVGGEARAQEMTEVTLPIIGKPTYMRGT